MFHENDLDQLYEPDYAKNYKPKKPAKQNPTVTVIMQESNDQYYWDQHKRSSVSPSFNRSVDSKSSKQRPDFDLRLSST